MSDSKGAAIRDKIADLQSEHWLKGNSLNLGQYKAEYTCACGEKFIEDGHSQDPYKASARLMLYQHIAEAILAILAQEVKPDKVDRFEVIDETGRAYVKGSIYGSPVSIELSYQDDGRTLKVFVSDRKAGLV